MRFSHFGPHAVGKIEAARALYFTKLQHARACANQTLQYQLLKNRSNPQISIKRRNPPWAQGVRGSNPRAPTNIFKQINFISVFPASLL
jgi:4'-phosphopantetheinyl transferase EntD